MEKIIFDRKSFEHKLKSCGDGFDTYGRIYFHTNENLKEYIKNLSGKKVLSVSASGDQILNCMGAGSTHIDTFDINKYSYYFQTLKINAVRYLSIEEALFFIDSLDYGLYLKFNNNLPFEVKNFFDFLFSNYSINDLKKLLFFESDVDSKMINNYYDLEILAKIKSRNNELINSHFCTNLYSLAGFLRKKYDTMFLSNISFYCTPRSFFTYIKYLCDYYLNDDGTIFFGYVYNSTDTDNPISAIRRIGDMYKECFLDYDFIDDISLINIDSAEKKDKKDIVLALNKKRIK